MSANVLFVIMTVIAAMLLLTASITAAIGAEKTFNSALYNTDSKIRSAHKYLTIASALGWASLAVLIVILIVAAIAGGFTTTEVSQAILSSDSPTKNDLLAAYKGEKELTAGETTQIIVIVILIIILLITMVVGIMAGMAAVEISGTKLLDIDAKSAYTYAIVTAVAGVGGIGVMIIAIIAYISIRSARQQHLAAIQEFEKKAELKLGIKPDQLATLTQTVITTTPIVVHTMTPTTSKGVSTAKPITTVPITKSINNVSTVPVVITK